MSLSKNQLIIGITGFLIIASLAFGVTYAVSSGSNESATVPTAASAIGTKSNPHQVALVKGNKEPIDLLIKTGEYVQFNSKDGGEHQIIQGLATNTEHGETPPAENDHQEGESRPEKSKVLDSGVIKADEGYLLQFKDTGKFEFHDNYDHEYTITVLVYDPNADNTVK